mgnify:CR=1 FL=1
MGNTRNFTIINNISQYGIVLIAECERKAIKATFGLNEKEAKDEKAYRKRKPIHALKGTSAPEFRNTRI